MIKKAVIGLIRIYQVFSRYVFPNPVCRFEPSCSHYSIEAVEKYGALKGSLLTAYRLIRCNPLCRGGYDPVK